MGKKRKKTFPYQTPSDFFSISFIVCLFVFFCMWLSFFYYSQSSRPQASVPNQDDDDLLYDIKYYSRDVRRQPSRISVMSNTPIQAGRTETPLLGSPGNNNPDLNKLGASHLRSAMATNHPDMQAELLKHKQTHLPKFVWENDTSFADMLVSQELPPCPGAPMKWNLPFTPENHPGAKW